MSSSIITGKYLSSDQVKSKILEAFKEYENFEVLEIAQEDYTYFLEKIAINMPYHVFHDYLSEERRSFGIENVQVSLIKNISCVLKKFLDPSTNILKDKKHKYCAYFLYQERRFANSEFVDFDMVIHIKPEQQQSKNGFHIIENDGVAASNPRTKDYSNIDFSKIELKFHND